MLRRFLKIAAWLALVTGSAAPSWGQAASVYLAIADEGVHDGSSCANAHGYTWFNTAGNWGTGATQIGPGTTITLCSGTTYNIAAGASALTFQRAGTAGGPITLQFQDSSVVLQSPHFGPNGAIAMKYNYLVFDGKGGLIQNTLAGSPGATCPGGPCQQFYGILDQYGTRTVGIDSMGCSGCVIENIQIRNLYVHTKCETTLSRWQANHGYTLGQQILGYPGYLETVTTAGTSGASEPTASTYTTTGQSTADGSVAWQTGAFTCDILADFANFEAFFGSAESGSQTVHDVTISNVGAGYYQYSGSGPTTSLEIYNCDIGNFDHGFFGGNFGTVKIHDCRMHDSDNWDSGTPDEYHHDGIHIGQNTTSTNFYLYNNLFDGNEGDCCITSWMFLQGTVANTYVYNNVFLTKAVANFGQWSGTLGYFLNNTIIGVAPSYATDCYSGGAATQIIENNVFSGCGTYLDITNSTALTATGNVYVGYKTTGNPTWRFSHAGVSTQSFGTWQAAGFDPTPTGGNPGTYYNGSATLNAQLADQLTPPILGQPNATGFQGAGIGVNLTSLAFPGLTSDTSAGFGNGAQLRTPFARPGSGNWDAGAFRVAVPMLHPALPPPNLLLSAH